MPIDPAVPLAAQLLSDYLAERTARPVLLETSAPVPETDAVIATGAIDGKAIAAAIAFIAPQAGPEPWYRAKADLERRIHARLPAGGYLVWAPPPAALPEREPLSSDIVRRTEETLARFVPGGHGEIRFPVPIYLRKSDEQGAYVTARGGLAPAWAQFTNRVSGHFQLDSSDLHRLPAGEGHLRELIERIVDLANGMELGQTREVMAEDAWVAQRLRGGQGVAFIGEPPGSERSSGAGLRRMLRQTMQALRAPLLAQDAAARVVLFVGPYASIDQQPVASSLLGFDPALSRGIDLILLAAEGTVKPVLDLTRNPLLRE